MLSVVQVLEFFITFIILFNTLFTIYKKGVIISVRWCAYYIFNVFFVLPNLVMLANWPLVIPAYGYMFIKGDWQIEIVYTVFMFVANESLRRGALKSIRKTSLLFSNIKNLSVKIPKLIVVVAFIGTLLPLFVAVSAPQPELYFLSFAPFSRTNEFNISPNAYQWHDSCMNWATKIGMVCVIVLWYKLQRESKSNRIIGKCYLFCNAITIMLFTSKRTLGTLLLLVMMIIEIIYHEKGIFKKIAFWGGIVVVYFVLYQSVVKKTVGGGTSSAIEMYIIYFSRILDFRYVTYSILHQSDVKILDYPCQSFLFDILPFVKRSMWTNKPYPFGVYYTAAWNNQPIESISYRYTVSWFAEAFANLAWIGIPVGIWLYNKMLEFFDTFKNPIVKIFSIYVAVYFMVTHVQSNYLSFGILIMLYILLERKRKKKNRRMH